MKNVIKAVKKLKLWTRKRRRKKTHEPYYSLPPPYPPPPPPLPCHYCYSCSTSTEPSAPPLPSWLEAEAEQNYGTFMESSRHSIPEVAPPSQAQDASQEIGMDHSSSDSNLPASRGNSSYQQYLVPKPVYGVPVIQTARTERSNRIFGCVLNFGIHVFRCLCPCFHIREVD